MSFNLTAPGPNTVGRSRRFAWAIGAGAGLLILIGAATVTRTKAGEPVGWDSMKRDVERLEEDLDDLLLDSPNFLVSGRDDAHGIYIDEVGLILTFDASLVGSNWNGSRSWSWNGFEMHRGHVVIRDLGDLDDEEDEDRDRSDRDRSDRESRRDRDRSRESRRFERGKEELVDFMIDSKDMVGDLRGDQWLMVVACMRDSRYLDREEISRVVVKARVADLKAHDSGGLSAEALRGKITIEEY